MTQTDTSNLNPNNNSGPAEQLSDREFLIRAQQKGSAATILSYFKLSGPGWLQSAITLGGGSLISSLFLGVLGGVSLLWVQVAAMLFGVIMLSAISYVALSSRLRPFDAINQHINPVLGYGWLLATILANVIWCMPQFSLCFDALDSGILSGQLDPKVSAVAQSSSSKNDQVSETIGNEKTEEKKESDPVTNNSDTKNSGASANSSSKVQNEVPSPVDPETNKNNKTPLETKKSAANSSWFSTDSAGTLHINFFGDVKEITNWKNKFGVSFLVLFCATTMVIMSSRGGRTAFLFDLILKGIIGLIVICFVGVVVVLTTQGSINWSEIGSGFIPNLSLWNQPTDSIRDILGKLSPESQKYWSNAIVNEQRRVMASAFATAVGINMTFLLPYSLLARKWDKPFRGLARFDLIFGMLLPFLLVTSCVVIAAASAFHGKADTAFLSSDPDEIVKSDLFSKASKILAKRLKKDDQVKKFDQVSSSQSEMAHWVASVSENERLIACNLVQRSSKDMAKAMAPLFSSGEKESRTGAIVFSVGVLAMGFSTIIILMMINGYAVAELVGAKMNSGYFIVGILIAGLSGFVWPLIWQGGSKTWLAIVASTFGLLLLPIAYGSFFLLMNSRDVLGNERPSGIWRWIWNVLLGVSFSGTIVAVGATLVQKITSNEGPHVNFILGAGACFLVLVVIGFFDISKRKRTGSLQPTGETEGSIG